MSVPSSKAAGGGRWARCQQLLFLFHRAGGCCRAGCVTEVRKLPLLQQPELLEEVGNLGSCCSSSKKLFQ